MYFQKEMDTSVFTKEKVEEWFHKFISSPVLSYYIVPRGYENTTIIIKSATKSYVLRHSVIAVGDPYTTLAEQKLRAELDYIAFLHDRRHRVPSLYRAKDDNQLFVSYFTEESHTYLVLMDLIPGSHKGYNYPMLKQKAKLLAKLHQENFIHPLASPDLLEYSAFSYRMKDQTEDPIMNINVDEIYYSYVVLYRDIRAELSEFFIKEKKLMIHNDVKRDNVIFLHDDINGIIDFGDCRVSIKEEDLGCVIWDLCDKFARQKRDYQPYVISFLKAYAANQRTFTTLNARMAINYALDRYLIINLHYLRVNQYSEKKIKYQVKKAANQLKIIQRLIKLRDLIKI